MLRVVVFFLALASAGFAADPAVLIEQVERMGYSHHAHTAADLRFSPTAPWRNGWLVLASRDGVYVALLVDIVEEPNSVASHVYVLPGIAHQTREFLLLRSSTRHWGATVLLTRIELTLELSPGPDGDLVDSRYRIRRAWGKFESVSLGNRTVVSLDMTRVRNSRRRGICSRLLIQAHAFFERALK